MEADPGPFGQDPRHRHAALDRSIIAYNENSDDEERRRCQEETETLAILVGLEIDSASGVRPDLDEYLGQRTVKRTPCLQYKSLMEQEEERHAWYEPTFNQQLDNFFNSVDWSEVDSNVERLPYLARQLKSTRRRSRTSPRWTASCLPLPDSKTGRLLSIQKS